jgi:hypothetical protein
MLTYCPASRRRAIAPRVTSLQVLTSGPGARRFSGAQPYNGEAPLREGRTASAEEANPMANKAFEKWAAGFSGCDGGNPNGSIWICGIEFGLGHDLTQLRRNIHCVDASRPPSLEDADWSECELRSFPSLQYNCKALKLLCALDGRYTSHREFYHAERCFRRDSNYFKLNLYPIGFRNTSDRNWTEWHAEETGLENRSEYLRWCHEHRFQAMRDWVDQFKPKLIICTGKTRCFEFFSAFGAQWESRHTDETTGKQIVYSTANAGKTFVAVIYFLGGRYGLNSDLQILDTGRKLKQLHAEAARQR